jgi:2-oxoglutarate ferredoxin oxidoreductase subunit delta
VQKTDDKKLCVDKKWCKGCGICVEFCPKDVLEIRDGKVNIKNIDQCIKCGQCELRCPDYAIYLGGK